MRRIFAWRLHNRADIPEFGRLLRELLGRVTTVERWELSLSGADAPDDDRWHGMLLMDFDSIEKRDSFVDGPEHMAVLPQLREYLADRSVVEVVTGGNRHD